MASAGSLKKKRSSSNGSLNSSFGDTNAKIKKKGVEKQLMRMDSQEVHPNDVQVLKTFLQKDENVGKIIDILGAKLGKTLPELVKSLNMYIVDLSKEMLGVDKNIEKMQDDMFNIDIMPVTMLMQAGRTEQAFKIIRDTLIVGQSFYIKDKFAEEKPKPVQ
jgi:hypothetical protein